MPPYPQYAGADWAEIWRTHLDGNPPWLFEWLRHQTEDDYWRQGSLKVDYGAITCPVFHIGGWQDAYVGSVFRMAQHLKAPNRALVGPWQHSRPNDAYPEPRVNHLHEMVRWWAYWLRGEDTGIMREPQIALYVNHGARPHPFAPHMPGRWRYEPRWPPERLREHTLYLAGSGALRAEPEPGGEGDAYRYQATVGLTAGFFCPLWPPYGMARDQAFDEARSQCYSTPPLEQPLEILGVAKAILQVASTAEVAFFAVKISDVGPDGSSTLVTRGVLNATHRASHSAPEPLTPGQVYELEIDLKVASWVFQPGHRLRVAISSADWPTIWPSPQPAVNTIFRGSARPSRIVLPVIDADPPGLPEPRLQPAVALRPTAKTWPVHTEWTVTEDIIGGSFTARIRDCQRVRPEGEPFEVEEDLQAQMTASDARPDQATALGLQRISMIESDRRTDLIGRAAIRSTATHLHVDMELRVTTDGEPLFQRTWMETIPRNLG